MSQPAQGGNGQRRSPGWPNEFISRGCLMAYSVKEIFFTLQGEGRHTGRPAVFLRFAGCNLWTGREGDRGTAVCQFCDTDFVGADGPGGGKFRHASDLAQAVLRCWQEPPEEITALRANPPRWLAVQENPSLAESRAPYVVCTGGEPLLQLDKPLIRALHQVGCQIAIETNGTIAAPPGIDWICVSPKAGAPFVQQAGNELKLVYPQPPFDPASFVALPFDHFYLQPMDGPHREENTAAIEEYCQRHPIWKISRQTHKLLGIP